MKQKVLSKANETVKMVSFPLFFFPFAIFIISVMGIGKCCYDYSIVTVVHL